MREGIKTSLISLVCATAVSVGFAAPSVRAVGGSGTVNSAASATSSRSGSLRTTGGYVRPTATTTTALKAATTAPTSTAAATAATPATTTSVGRVATSPRLSIGKYIGGTPKATSTSNPSSELTQRLDKLESDVDKVDADKQDTLKDSTYISIQDNELILDVEKIRTDLDLHAGKDGREVEIGTNDSALLWRYAGDADWTELIEWAAMKSKLGLGDVRESIDNAAEVIAQTKQDVDDINTGLAEKISLTQFADNKGMALVVDEEGKIVAAGNFANADDVYTKDKVYSKEEVYNKDQVYAKDKVYTKDETYGKGDVYNKTEINSQITGVNMELANKVDKFQGADKVGKPLVIGSDGNVIVSSKDIPTIDNIGLLAFKDSVSNGDVDDGTLERSKMAASITETLAWIDEWRNSMPTEPGERYVFAIDENGDAGWFKVAE
ncbi:MAG: hypothetical protein J5611_01580 [Alphaproteobacteria bacterium]|nr:hypothetical protein [Alphaproteobacteria bacterium]